MSSIQAVLFDLGGTLFDYKVVATSDLESHMELLHRAGIEADPADVKRAYKDTMRQVFKKYLQRPFYLYHDLFQDALKGMFESLGGQFRSEDYDHYRNVLMERYTQNLSLRGGVIETLSELKNRGLHLGLVSNIDNDQLGYLMEITKIGPYFDSLLSSEGARSCKPDSGIFHEALRRADCKPHQALFIGDTIAQDIAGANRVGLRSVLIWHRDDRDPPENSPRPHHTIRHIPEIIEVVDSYN
ncbi:HAD family hydrolase [Thermodesulfobacteriota bacterium]